MTPYDLCKKILGQVVPVGDSTVDAQRLENLRSTTDLIDSLLADIQRAAESRDRPEHSMRQIGQRANSYLNGLSEWETS